MPLGQPLKFQSVEELEKKIQQYFESCFETHWEDEEVRDSEGKPVFVKSDIGRGVEREIRHVKVKKQIEPITITGLAYHLHTNRQTLLNYQKDADYFDTITRAKNYIEFITEKNIANGNINANFGIFNMKNNWGWKDEFHNTLFSAELTPEQKKKWDEILLNKKPNEETQPTSTDPVKGSDKGGT